MFMKKHLPSIRNSITLSSLLLALFACASTNAENAPPADQVWLSKLLRIDDYLAEPQATIDSNREVLSNQLNAGWDFSIDVSEPGSSTTSAVNDCTSFLSVDQLHAEPVKTYEFAVYRSIGISCKAIQTALALHTSNRSFVRNLVFDKTLVERMPFQLALIISTEEEKRLQTKASIHYWSDFESIESVEAEETNTYLVKTQGTTQTLKLLAYGDANADGIEDILLRNDASVDEGTYSSSRLFVLTKKSENSELEILKVTE